MSLKQIIGFHDKVWAVLITSFEFTLSVSKWLYIYFFWSVISEIYTALQVKFELTFSSDFFLISVKLQYLISHGTLNPSTVTHTYGINFIVSRFLGKADPPSLLKGIHYRFYMDNWPTNKLSNNRLSFSGLSHVLTQASIKSEANDGDWMILILHCKLTQCIWLIFWGNSSEFSGKYDRTNHYCTQDRHEEKLTVRHFYCDLNP